MGKKDCVVIRIYIFNQRTGNAMIKESVPKMGSQGIILRQRELKKHLRRVVKMLWMTRMGMTMFSMTFSILRRKQRMRKSIKKGRRQRRRRKRRGGNDKNVKLWRREDEQKRKH